MKLRYRNKLFLYTLIFIISVSICCLLLITFINNLYIEKYKNAKINEDLIEAANTFNKIFWYQNYEKEKEVLSEELLTKANKLYNNYFLTDSLEYLYSALRLNYSNEIKNQIEQLEKYKDSQHIFIEGKPVNEQNSFIPELETGNAVRIFIYYPDNTSKINIELKSENNEDISQAEAFYMKEYFEINAFYSIIGIPETIAEGKYKIEIKINPDELFKIPVEIKRKESAYEYIYIGKHLGEILELKKDASGETKRLYRDLKTQRGNILETGRFIMPIQNVPVTSGFGDKRIFIYPDGNEVIDYHIGIDYGAVAGTQVHAIGSGKVVFIGNYVITGKTLVIEHLPGLYSLYFHLSEILVSKNEIINKDDIICKVGNTGLSTAAHLHLSVFAFGIPVDPDYFLEKELIFIPE